MSNEKLGAEQGREQWGECIVCGMCSTLGHEWWCQRSPYQAPCPPKMGAGELDGQNLIDMNNVAVGFVWPSNTSSGICWTGSKR